MSSINAITLNTQLSIILWASYTAVNIPMSLMSALLIFIRSADMRLIGIFTAVSTSIIIKGWIFFRKFRRSIQMTNASLVMKAKCKYLACWFSNHAAQSWWKIMTRIKGGEKISTSIIALSLVFDESVSSPGGSHAHQRWLSMLSKNGQYEWLQLTNNEFLPISSIVWPNNNMVNFYQLPYAWNQIPHGLPISEICSVYIQLYWTM